MSELPLFAASYVGLAVIALTVHSIDLANNLGLAHIRNAIQELSAQLASVPLRLDVVRSEHATVASILDGQLAALSAAAQSLEAGLRGILSNLPGHLELPDETRWAFVSAVALVIGTTIYQSLCPPAIKRFSELEWVSQLRRPRLLHVAESLSCGPPARRRFNLVLQVSTAVLVLSGGLLAIVLLGARLWKLWQLILTYSP